jgi:trans-aconitate methyltransferase
VPSEWAESWQRSWERLEEMLVPDRERQISALLDVVEAMAGAAPTVVDLACGPGTITCRLFDRLPRARSIAVDVDPVLLTIASAAFADDGNDPARAAMTARPVGTPGGNRHQASRPCSPR